MRQLYGKTITPYLADGAGWAKKLFDGWSNDRALDVLMKPIINNGVSGFTFASRSRVKNCCCANEALDRAPTC